MLYPVYGFNETGHILRPLVCAELYCRPPAPGEHGYNWSGQVAAFYLIFMQAW
jgi:hypothetical protein